MKKTWAVGVGLLFVGAALPAVAQVGVTRTQFFYVMPASVDPRIITFTSDGQTFVIDEGDANVPSSVPAPLTGRTFLSGAGNGNGLEIHAQVPGGPGVGVIQTVDFSTNYTSPIDLQSFADFGFQPWDFFDISATTPGFQTFRFVRSLGGAPITDFDPSGPFFALASATTPDNALDPNSFQNATFSVTGFTGRLTPSQVPEPGSVALGAALLMGGAAAAWRKRRAPRR